MIIIIPGPSTGKALVDLLVGARQIRSSLPYQKRIEQPITLIDHCDLSTLRAGETLAIIAHGCDHTVAGYTASEMLDLLITKGLNLYLSHFAINFLSCNAGTRTTEAKADSFVDLFHMKLMDERIKTLGELDAHHYEKMGCLSIPVLAPTGILSIDHALKLNIAAEEETTAPQRCWQRILGDSTRGIFTDTAPSLCT